MKTENFSIIPPHYKPIPFSEEDIKKSREFYLRRHPIPEGNYWTCFCGSNNTGKFCPECGSKAPENWEVKP